MARRYQTLKFIYTNDLGINQIKRQRVYLDENNQQITPITSLFLARVVNFEEKVTGTSQGIRHFLSYIGKGKFQSKLPYKESNNLKAHIQEILAVDRVICGDYIGERLIIGGTTNNFQQSFKS